MWKLHISADGSVISGVYSDQYLGLMKHGEVEIKRASHVEPSTDDDGNPCWYADLSPVGGPMLGPYYERGKALNEEVDWLDKNLFAGRGDANDCQKTQAI